SPSALHPAPTLSPYTTLFRSPSGQPHQPHPQLSKVRPQPPRLETRLLTHRRHIQRHRSPRLDHTTTRRGRVERLLRERHEMQSMPTLRRIIPSNTHQLASLRMPLTDLHIQVIPVRGIHIYTARKVEPVRVIPRPNLQGEELLPRSARTDVGLVRARERGERELLNPVHRRRAFQPAARGIKYRSRTSGGRRRLSHVHRRVGRPRRARTTHVALRHRRKIHPHRVLATLAGRTHTEWSGVLVAVDRQRSRRHHRGRTNRARGGVHTVVDDPRLA